MRRLFHKGFTLAELLITIAILGVLATFAIPKLLSSQQKSASNAAAHEVVGMISGAYQAYKQDHFTVPTTTWPGALTPYMNYVAVDTSSQLDDMNTLNTSYTCGSGGINCLRLHNGGILFYNGSVVQFGGTSANNAIYFMFDPDGVKGSSGAADGPSKSISVILFYNGRVTTWGNTAPNTLVNGYALNPGPYDPSWFKW